MNPAQLSQLRIANDRKRRNNAPFIWIVVAVVAITSAVGYAAWPRTADNIRSMGGSKAGREGVIADKSVKTTAATRASSESALAPGAGPERAAVEGSILTVPGYIVAHERIEISPRFMGVVKWIGVRKGDAVTNGQTLALLDDAEYRARMAELDGQLAVANVGVEKAQMDLRRAEDLVSKKVEMQKMLDDARLALDLARAQVKQAEGARKLTETYLDWCIIRSPVNGVIMERLVDPDELVTPQTFGGARSPSTSILAVADLDDLQVEIDVNETYLSKIGLRQKCKVSPEAYPERLYDGYVAEMAPEASRQKGTLQIKVQIVKPDRYLTPELSAKVDFLPIH
jgi:HlyD family secretion protein